jgi:hypothetical protein
LPIFPNFSCPLPILIHPLLMPLFGFFKILKPIHSLPFSDSLHIIEVVFFSVIWRLLWWFYSFDFWLVTTPSMILLIYFMIILIVWHSGLFIEQSLKVLFPHSTWSFAIICKLLKVCRLVLFDHLIELFEIFLLLVIKLLVDFHLFGNFLLLLIRNTG